MAKKKGEARVHVNLACSKCKERNYTTTKNRKNDPERMSLDKYCPRCREHTPHKEQK